MTMRAPLCSVGLPEHFALPGREEHSALTFTIVEVARERTSGAGAAAVAMVLRVRAFGLEGMTKAWFSVRELTMFREAVEALWRREPGTAAATLETWSPEHARVQVGLGDLPDAEGTLRVTVLLEVRATTESAVVNTLHVGFTSVDLEAFVAWLGDVGTPAYLDALEGAAFDAPAVEALRPSVAARI